MTKPPSRPGPIHDYLAGDHDRLGSLLDRALAQPGAIDPEPYEAFRAGLLRHIGVEEKLLFPRVRRSGTDENREMVDRLHREHALFAAMLVPQPTVEILARLRELLVDHNLREERDAGLYVVAEGLAGDQTDQLAAEMRAAPEARVAPHYDTALVHENIRALLEALSQP